MSYVVTEFFKVNGDLIVPVEYRFVKCKLVLGEEKRETCHWMNPHLWKELIESTEVSIKEWESLGKITDTEPKIITTGGLKLAYIFKENILKQQIIINFPNNEGVASCGNSPKMLIISVSLKTDECAMLNLNAALGRQQISTDQAKVSDYFKQY